MATLAHELRNPLASILAGIEVLKQDSNPENIKSCQVVERQVQQMIHLVNDLLDISRISLGKIKLSMQPVNLIDSIHLALETSRQIIEGYKHALAISLPAGPVMVHGDASRLCQVFLNILINSAKYTPPGGNISLTVSRKKHTVEVSVRDNGMGIPPEMLSSIFEMFEQIQDRSEYPQAGLGIGLSVVKQLVEMHGGLVEARSEGSNQGSEFIVTFPLLQNGELLKRSNAKVVAEEKLTEPQTRNKRKILLVDDNADATDMMEILLKRRGYIIRKANDGKSGISEALDFDPDIIILDLGLPDLDGYSVLKTIREKLGKRFFLALSGWGQQEDIIRSREAGFDRHLVKPVDINSLLAVLESS